MLALNMIDYIPDVEGSAEYFRVSLPKPQTQTQNITLGAAPAAQQAQQSAGAHRPPELTSGSGRESTQVRLGLDSDSWAHSGFWTGL
jgi:hypothetical protein